MRENPDFFDRLNKIYRILLDGINGINRIPFLGAFRLGSRGSNVELDSACVARNGNHFKSSTGTLRALARGNRRVAAGSSNAFA